MELSGNKTILSLCSGTGAWERPYIKAGYNVISVTLPEQDVRDYIPPDNVYGILAAPPCTEFSFAKHFHGKGNYNHNFIAGLEIVSACMRIVLTAKPVWWALENPDGYLKKWLRNPVFTFEPYFYGDNYQKKTCLWGVFNIPQPKTTEKPKGLIKFSMLKSKDIYPEFYGKLTRQKRRAITPAGFAKAFFRVNQ